jgi:hypothetical protein
MRHDNPDLTDSSGNRIVPRTLLQEAIVTATEGDVVLNLPATPWKRFEVQIEDWAPTSDQVAPILQLGVNGAVRAGASDYQLNVQVYPSNTTLSTDFDDANSNIRLTRDDNTVQMGNGANESFSFNIFVDPGSSVNHLPKVWWQGAGINDSGRLMGVIGNGAYRGTTSGEFGRADQIRLAVDSNTIARGVFRLYGTE